jgi:hypothetical protein
MVGIRCGEKWTLESLKDNIKFDHGYTASSLPLQHFLQILVELEHEDQVDIQPLDVNTKRQDVNTQSWDLNIQRWG